MGEGMQMGRDQLINSPEASPHAARTMILLTDGQPNVGPDPFSEAQACRAANITVHTISYSNFANTTLMQSIAQETGGDSAIKWSGELLEEHRARTPRHTPLELSL